MYRFKLLIAVIIAQLSFHCVYSECTNKDLNLLDLEKCNGEIRNQFSWEIDDFDPQMCLPHQIYLLFDISNTVRRSKTADDLNMLEIQEKYLKLLLEISQTNSSVYTYLSSEDVGFPINDNIVLIPYATKAQILASSTMQEANSSLLWYLSDVESKIHLDQELKNFYFGNNKGWSQISNGYQAIIDDLKLLEAEEESNIDQIYDNLEMRPIVVLMTDGKPESRIGMTRETRFMNRYADKLKERFGAHIHCVVLKFNKFGKGFWKKTGMCDSKQLFTKVSDVNVSSVIQTAPAIITRKLFCESYVTPTATPTGVPTTASPTSVPSSSPSIHPTASPTKAPVESCNIFESSNQLERHEWDIDGSVISINNLGGFCGTDGVEGVTCGSSLPKHVRYEGVLNLNGERIDLILSNSSLFTVKPQLGLTGTGITYPIGKSGKFGEVQLRQASNVTLKFEFVNSNDEPVTLPGIDFTVFDLDQSKCTCIDCDCLNCLVREVLTINVSQFEGSSTTFSVFENENSALCSALEDDDLVIKSSVAGGVADNPTDPKTLNDFAKSVSILTRFFNVTSFEVNYMVEGGSLLGGRRFLFAGASNVNPCPDS